VKEDRLQECFITVICWTADKAVDLVLTTADEYRFAGLSTDSLPTNSLVRGC
jgi:hypothetical protein